MNFSYLRTSSTNKDFGKLVTQLNAYLKTVDGDDHDYYMQYNGVESLKNVILVYHNQKPIGCGAFKHNNNNTVEVKRMFTSLDYRRNGVAAKILLQLEVWAAELGYKKLILETGKRQVEAVNFYKKEAYKVIANFAPYEKMENSLCFEKVIA